jgi:dTDP-4-dehydrorhamnose reductase
MKILLAGAGGQLGRQIHKQAAPGRHEIVALSRRDLDIENLAAARAAAAAHRPDIILNAAAFNDVDRAESDQDAA